MGSAPRSGPGAPLALLAAACALLQACVSAQPAATPARSEPGVVALKNSSGRHLDSVRVQEVSDAPDGPARLASVSPLLDGNTFSIRRPSNPRPLPAVARVEWQYAGGRRASAAVSLSEALGRATGAPGEAIVFQVHPDGRVQVVIEILRD